MALTSTATTTTTTASCPPSSLLAQGERRRQAEQHEQAFRKLSMSSDSVSTATVLQHHNYANSSFPTPPPSVNASNTNSPPPAPPSPLTSFLPLSPQSDGSEPHQLLIHSEDPLLSSTIKDITRKKIDLGSLTVLGSVLVERGGELHLIQAPTAIVQKLSGRNTKPKHSVDTLQSFTTTESQAAITGALNAPSYQMMPQYFKSEDIEDEVFLSPPIVPDSPPSLNSPARGPCPTAKSLGAAPVSGQPLCSPRAKRPRLARPYPAYKSRLRSCRREAICSASMPFTPAPMLDPNRTGPGLMAHAGSSWHCSSTTADGEDSCDAMAISAPESDSFPHVNVGARFQCAIPSCDKRPYSWSDEPSSGQNYLLWEPGVVEKCTDAEVDAYLDFACCDAIPWGGRNQEYALHLLHMCDGDIQEAMVQLMQRSPILPADHSLLSYDYGVTELWSVEEMDTFVKALSKHMKNWTQVAKEVGNKTARECVQFYYLWKRLCPDEYNFIRSAWKEKEMMADDMNNNVQEDSNSKKSNLPWHKQNLNSSSILPLDTKLTNLDDFQNVAISLGEGSCMKGNTQSGTSVRSMSSSVSSSNNPIQFGKITYNANENGSTGNTSIVQVDATPTTNTSPSSDTTQTAVEPKISSKQHSVEVAKDLEDQMALISNNFDDERAGEIKRKVPSNVKTEPWEYCIKKEVKEELESIATDFSETKVYISEFDVVKLNHISNSTKDDDETVEEAPIIVNRSTHLNDDADDQVKMEIESMMALHGIRMEDDVSTEAINSETGTGDTQTIFKEEPQDCDLVKDTSSSSPTALTEEHVSTSSESRLFVCELADCSASFNSRAALNGHIRIHGYRKSPPPNMNAASHRLQRQEYHCETCGKSFAKLKSRNAHMKTHKLSSADLAETLAGRATGISSSGDLPSNPRSSSSGLSFSTCLNFGLPQSECKAANKEFTSEDETEGQEEMSLEKITCSPQQESSSSKDNCSSKSSSETNKKRTGSKKIPGARPISDCSRSISASSIFRSNNVLAGKPILTVSCTSSVPITNPVNDNVQQLSSHSDKKSSPSSTVKLPETSSTAADELSCKPLSIHQHKVSNKPVTSEPQKAFLKKLKAKSKQSPSAFCSLGRVK